MHHHEVYFFCETNVQAAAKLKQKLNWITNIRTQGPILFWKTKLVIRFYFLRIRYTVFLVLYYN